ncbi:MAG: FAD-dependent oxidoreductase, partial [bacterium]|nr:FAD-dependent oxidoreductase [bacterium]
TGRKPYTEGLALTELGIEHTPKGIAVNNAYQTNVPSVYAIGDVLGGVMLAHWAAHQGITAVEHALGENPHLEVPSIPGCIFTFPEIATVGLTEDAAKEAFGGNHQTSKFMFGANGKALSLGEGEGFVKVVADDKGIIVGLHIMGPHASDLIHEGVIAIEKQMTAEDFKPMVHAHPTLSESVYEAIMGLQSEAIHMAPTKK